MPESKLSLEKPRQKGDAWLGVALLATAAIVLLFSRSIQAIGLGDNLDPGPKGFPIGLSILLILGGLVELWHARGNRATGTRNLGSHADSVGESPASNNHKVVLTLLATFLVYVVLLPWLGFSLSTLAMATGMMMLLGNSWKSSLLVTVFLIATIYILFVVLFKVPLPNGVLGLPF